MSSAFSIPAHNFTAQEVSHAVISAAMRVHSELGAGLLESAYTACLQFELKQAGLGSLAQLGLRLCIAE